VTLYLHSFPTRRSSDLYAAEALHRSGIPIAEITMTVPGALDVISDLASRLPEIIVGAGTVLDAETASSRFFPARLSEATITSGRSEEHTSELQSRENLV